MDCTSKCFMFHSTNHFHPCMVGVGPKPCDVMLVGEAPGFKEDILGEPFMGAAGALLTRILIALGVDRDGLFITNTFGCRPPENKLPIKKHLMECWKLCKPRFLVEIKKVKPKVVVLMGATPLMLLKGLQPITKYEGMEVEPDLMGHKCRVFSSYHPAYALRRSSSEIRIASSLVRAFKAAGIDTDIGGMVNGRKMYPYEIKE